MSKDHLANPLYNTIITNGLPPSTSEKYFPVEKRLPWGVILLLGGGFALADATKQTGLSKYIGHQLVALKDIPIRCNVPSNLIFFVGLRSTESAL